MSSSPPDGATHDAQPTSTREQLLHAVIAIAGEEGQHAVTHRSVAARAQVTHGLVRHYFGTRQAMLEEALERAITEDISEVRLSTDRLESFAEGLTDTEDWSHRVLQYDVVLNAIRGIGDRALATGLYDRYLSAIGQTLDSLGIEDEDGAKVTLLFAALDGLVLQHALFRSTERTEAALRLLRQLLGQLAAAGRDAQQPDSRLAR
ncbi:TetR/AcrR family transcriptional regulator [Geodermatophilus sp. CPCC 206100]|uniref:TetR/AcrR family transcriptional regulator n=1 Tax=Geodermatophilus sp. CPCC 206100 TaxID=3020054 RepID=UPI003B00390D